jgi:hypothetical protein
MILFSTKFRYKCGGCGHCWSRRLDAPANTMPDTPPVSIVPPSVAPCCKPTPDAEADPS